MRKLFLFLIIFVVFVSFVSGDWVKPSVSYTFNVTNNITNNITNVVYNGTLCGWFNTTGLTYTNLSVGINTSSPTQVLDVRGNVNVSGNQFISNGVLSIVQNSFNNESLNIIRNGASGQYISLFESTAAGNIIFYNPVSNTKAGIIGCTTNLSNTVPTLGTCDIYFNTLGTTKARITQNGSLLVGISSGTAKIQIGSGTSISAPFKLTSGTDLTTPEAGAFEYDGLNLHFTNGGLLKRNLGTEQYVQSRGENLVTNGNGLLFDNTNFINFVFDSTETHGGGGSFKHSGASGSKTNDELIPVDTSKKYRLVVWGKAGNTNGTEYNNTNRQYCGVGNYDIDGNNIGVEHSAKLYGSTDTQITVQVNPGDTHIHINNSIGWYNSTTGTSRQFTWWPYTNNKGYTYPNYTYSRNESATYNGGSTTGAWSSPTSNSITNLAFSSTDNSLTRPAGSFLTDGIVVGDSFTTNNGLNPGPFTVDTVTATKITTLEAVVTTTANTILTYLNEGIINDTIMLRIAWTGPGLPVGTPIRNGAQGSTYKYITCVNVNVPNDWTKYEGFIGQANGSSLEATNQFRAGTSYVKVLFLNNYISGGQTGIIRWSDIWLSEMSAKNLENASNTQVGVVTLGNQTLGDGEKYFHDKVGIGTTFPSQTLDVNGSVNVSGGGNLTVTGLSVNLSVFTDANKKLITRAITQSDITDVVYVPFNISLTVGSSAQNITNLSLCNDGLYYNLVEANGVSPAMNLTVNFVNVTKFKLGYNLGYYVGTTSHYVEVYFKECSSGNYLIKNTFETGNSYVEKDMTVMNQSRFNCGGNVSVRYVHPVLGNPAHYQNIDCVQLLG